MDNANLDTLKATLTKVEGSIRITKITATKSVKSRKGDNFCGFSAAYHSVQDDCGGYGPDLVPDDGEQQASSSSGLTMKEARIAHYMVSRQAAIAAIESSVAEGGLSHDQAHNEIRQIKSNYQTLILRAHHAESPAVKSAGPDAEV